VLHSWKEELNNVRSHGSFGHSPPAQYRADWTGEGDPAEVQNIRQTWSEAEVTSPSVRVIR
jgi:hypothetical protein